ncbi:GspE/PulE family protein [Clostridium magnum]|uniref:Type II secretion system protein E n=1 Tax=Clostridium magnum DSM 2767 TaxID=1121326 RepID=A0A161XFS6_9CLOT|nr:GspE/PulE family protein [Clostridium magnum]KZL93396.1 type II secretion system protein E [Clostridium magnum DSM 2767]SHI15893.1 type IV pilus assembly protein PilB [Clostridium magnum DSM 2767]
MDHATKKRLGDMLVEEGKITTEQLSEALKKQREQGKRLGEILISQGIVSENEIINVLEQQLKIKRIKLDMINVDKKAVMSIPANLASKHTLIPVAFMEDKILVAMWDPLNIFAIDDVKIATAYDVQVLIATKGEINRAIERYYSDQYVQKAAEELSKEKKQEAKLNQQNEMEFEDIKNAPAVKMVDHIIKSGVEVKASDIHIEPFEEDVRIRYRVDGQLQQALKIPKDTQAALVTRIKILSNLNIAEKRIPQDGRIITKVDDKEIDLRISILPTVFGEKVVIRILNRDNYTIGRQKLGMAESEKEQLDRIIKNPHGIVLVTGPTGSGKSTTLYTILNDLNKVECNIVTVEDPVEYMLPGINQVNVNAKAGLTFASGLRSILRQDPDIVMIGEIRDSETAEIAVRAAITGHLVLSTIHTNDAPSSIARLIDMGTEPYLVATSVCGIISQRLVRKICPYCKVKYEANESEKKIMGFEKEKKLILHKGKGCGYCKNTGYSGRTGVYEIMEITRKHRELIASNANSDIIKDLSVEYGMRTLNMACKELVLKGVTTVDELVKVAFLNE